MTSNKKMIVVGAIIIFVMIIGLLLGTKSKSLSVCQIINDPYKYSEVKSLRVKGVVTSAISLWGLKGFKIKDQQKDCEIWIQTNRMTPRIGSTIVATGRLDDKFTIGDAKFIILVEN